MAFRGEAHGRNRQLHSFVGLFRCLEIKDWADDSIYRDGVADVGNYFFRRFIDHGRLVAGKVVDRLRIDALH